MSREYIQTEIDQIFKANEDQELALSLSAAWIIAHFKGVNLKIYDTNSLNPLAGFFVIGTVQNKIQAQSIASAMQKVLGSKTNIKSVEGVDEGEWVLLDSGDVIVHIFQESFREIYDLDRMWDEYISIQIPNEYYNSKPSSLEEPDADDSLKNYF